MLNRRWREVRAVLVLAVTAAIPLPALGQTFEPLDLAGKLSYHVERTIGPWALIGDAAYAGILQADAALRSGEGAPQATASASVPRWRGPASTAPSLLAWTRRCIRTRGTFGQPTLGSGGGRDMPFVELFLRIPIVAVKRCPPGVSAATMARPCFPTCGIRTGSILPASGLSRVR